MAFIPPGCGDSVQQRLWRSRSIHLSPEHVNTTAPRGANEDNQMNKKCICIFDLDGTLSNGNHRLHLLPKKDLHLTESWTAFNMAAGGDAPITDTIRVMKAMRAAGFIVIILTGRSDEAREITEKWLVQNGASHYDLLIMRAASDNRKDTVIKEEILRKIGIERIVAAWDDSPTVIAHFRSLGITTYQVCDYGENLHDHLKSHGVDK
nr:HAD-superfamily hydrolase [Klebsiella phage vB_Kpn_K2alpha62]